jgi:hypothetical protein
MTFQSANSNIDVTEEAVIRVQDVPENNIPVFGNDKKIRDSGISVNSIVNEIKAITYAIIF